MKQITIVGAAILLFATSVFALGASDEKHDPLEIHGCGNNPFTRSVGLLGGRQPQFFLKGPNTRDEELPRIENLTRVINVGDRRRLSDPFAEPEIDKCASWVQWSERHRIVQLTILWSVRNCSAVRTRDAPSGCRGRVVFGFTLDELGIRELPHTKQARRALESRLERDFVAEAYFSRKIRPRARRPDTGQWVPARAEVHLVARIIPVSAASSGVTTIE